MRTEINTLVLMFFAALFISICSNTNINAQASINYIENHSLTGTVESNSKPVQFVNVTIINLGLSTTTDKEGRFTFSGLNKGEYMLSFTLTGFASKTLSVNLGSNDTLLNISLSESLIETPVIDVTGSFNATDISKSTFSITELNSRTLSKTKSQTLAETIQNIPGISNVSTGSGIGKPVIRGLTSQSVLVIHDGVKQESQSWGDEHGPELSLFDLDRIEILRGPASLIYGSDGIGGVINVISKPLEFSTKKKPVVYGGFNGGFFSNDNQFFGNATLGFGFKNLGFKSHFGYRKSGNVKTPEGTFDVKTLDGTRQINGGILSNSGSNELESGASVGFNGKFGMLSLGFETFERELQIHEDPLEAPDATPNQKISTNQFSLDGNFDLSSKLKLEPVLSYQLQKRIEFESIEDKNSGIEALHLDLKTLDAALKLHHNLTAKISGTIGASFTYQQNKTLAEEKLIPNYDANTVGLYLMEKLDLGKIAFSSGIRFDTKKLNILSTVFQSDSSGNPVNVLQPQSLSFSSVTGSIGAVYSPVGSVNIFANIGRGWRPPSEFELFVDGVHEGTGRYERGIRTLSPGAEPLPEESLNFDLGLRLNYSSFSIQLSAFNNIVNNFIYPQITADTLEGFPVFNIQQAKSTFYGYEYNIQFQPVNWLVLSASGDYVHSKNEASGYSLPFTPPVKNMLGVKLQKQSIGSLMNPYFKLGAKFVSAQNNTDILETETGDYNLVNAGFGFDFAVSKAAASVDFSVENLLDTKYVDHLSRYKGYALNPGRSFNLQLTVPFRF